MAQKIVVTGATGNVGIEVVKLLQAAGQPVVAAVRDVARARPFLGDDLDWVAFDFGQPETYAPALTGADRLFLVRPPALSDAKKYINPVVENAKTAGVKHIVFLSLMGVEKNPLTPHFQIERYIKKVGLAYTFLRAGFFMQNLNTIHRADIKDQNRIFLPAGKAKTAFIDIRDIAAVAVKALLEPDHHYKAYPLTGAQALDYFEVADIFSQVLGREITYTNPSNRDYRQEMKARGLSDEFINVMSMLYWIVRWGGAAKVTPDTKRLLGRPPISMRKYVEDYAEVWRLP